MEAEAKVDTKVTFPKDIRFVEEYRDGEAPNVKDRSHFDANALETSFQTRDIRRSRHTSTQVYQAVHWCENDTCT